MDTDVTIFIPVRNGSNFIVQTIQSIINQTYRNWNLIIKDNCSTDNTKAIVSTFLYDSRIQWIERDQDVGSIGNYNSCLKDIPTRYYLILSHDDYLFSPDALEKAHRILETHPDILKVHCDMMFVDDKNRSIAPKHFGRAGVVESDIIARKSIVSVRNLYGIPLLIRSTAINGHRYDTAYPHAADVDFSIAVGKGACIYHIPEILIAIRFHRHNHTHGKFDTIAQELKLSAEKNQIELTKIEQLSMGFYNLFQNVAKRLFFIYLYHFRK
ncbi:MAG: glycosyltransferase [Deltaproteobacteria bacterium]|nr:glycosyltransferase [Deltaproteobacteria bacterium]